ncbi:MAG: ABC transporter ATP-binding protein [Albidovulum sp.]
MFEITTPALFRGRAPVLAPTTFTLPPGATVGIVGPNGAGKSTLLRAISGLSQETVTVRRGGDTLPRRAIGFLPQAFAVAATLSVTDCVLLGRREDLGWSVPKRALAEAQDLLRRFGLEDFAERPICTLSGGQQQRVLLVQRLFRKPALLLLDEPTSALDLHHQLSALSMIRDHARKTGIGVIAALHDLTLAARFCDRILVLADGRVVRNDVPEAAFAGRLIEDHWQVSPEFLRARDGSLVVVPHRLG